MSDTCWLRLTFPRKDLPKFNEVLKDELWDGVFWDEDNGDEGIIEAIVYEAHNGWYYQIHALAKAGLSFEVFHLAGASYGPCVYACYKGELVMCSSDWHGNPVAIVNKDGVSEAELQNCLKYHQLLDKVYKEVQDDETVKDGS